jgi:hypothetical protein
MVEWFETVFRAENRHRDFYLEWTEALRIAIALPLLFVGLFPAFGQSLYPGHLPSKKQVAP